MFVGFPATAIGRLVRGATNPLLPERRAPWTSTDVCHNYQMLPPSWLARGYCFGLGRQ